MEYYKGLCCFVFTVVGIASIMAIHHERSGWVILVTRQDCYIMMVGTAAQTTPIFVIGVVNSPGP
jgi:hypothetical protein